MSATPEAVAPHAGAWIEIIRDICDIMSKSSHPMRVRGLKFPPSVLCLSFNIVAPHAGAWIEIFSNLLSVRSFLVAPHAGAWIEIIFSALYTLAH